MAEGRAFLRGKQAAEDEASPRLAELQRQVLGGGGVRRVGER